MIMARRVSKAYREEGICDVRKCAQTIHELIGLYGDDEGTHQLCFKHRERLEDGFIREANRVFEEARSVWDAQQGCFVKGRPKSGKYVTAIRDENGEWRASLKQIGKIFDLKKVR